MISSRALAGLALVLGLAATAAANAQDAAPGQAPAAQSRLTDVQNIGDWTVRCFPIKSPTPCDMYEQLDEKTTHQMILAVSITYAPSLSRNEMMIVVPLGVSIAKGAAIMTSDFNSAALPFHHCERNGCYVETLVDDSSIDHLAHASSDAKIRVVADNGRSFDLNLSLKGFSDAHDAMVKLARQKATSAPAQ